MSGHVILSHGLESGPDATKVTALALTAERLGWSTERPDYRGLESPLQRRDLLLSRCRVAPTPRVLVGSSMGAYISGLVSRDVEVAGLFLLAPPLALPGDWPRFDCAAVPTVVVHGWHDELIPAREVIAFAESRALALHLVDDSHRLSAHVDAIAAWFCQYLDALR